MALFPEWLSSSLDKYADEIVKHFSQQSVLNEVGILGATAMSGGPGGSGGYGDYSPNMWPIGQRNTVPFRQEHVSDPTNLIYIRLNGVVSKQSDVNFEFMKAIVLKDRSEVVVFIITKDGGDVCLRDDMNLFPSDTLISKLRLLTG